MSSRETNLKLIENITVEVPNMVSISKDILFHVYEVLYEVPYTGSCVDTFTFFVLYFLSMFFINVLNSLSVASMSFC